MTRSSGAAVALPLPALALIVLPVAVLIATGTSILRQESPTLGCWILPNAAVAFAGSLDPVCPLKAYERIVRIDAGDEPVHSRSDLLAALPVQGGGPLLVTASRGSARRSVSIPIIDDSRKLRTAQLAVATVLSAVLMALGLSLWLRRGSPVSTPIAILCTTSAIFLAATIARASTPILDLIWVLAQGLLAAALCHLALVYPRERRLAERVPGIVTLLYAGALALTAMEWVGFHHNDALWEIADRTVATWIVAAVMALGVSSLLALHETSSARERVQARVLLMASSGAIALLATLALDPGGALPLAPRRTIAIALIGFLGLLTYLISRFGLLDVPLAVRWTAAHGVYATIVSGLAYGGLYFLSATSGTAPPPSILRFCMRGSSPHSCFSRRCGVSPGPRPSGGSLRGRRSSRRCGPRVWTRSPAPQRPRRLPAHSLPPFEKGSTPAEWRSSCRSATQLGGSEQPAGPSSSAPSLRAGWRRSRPRGRRPRVSRSWTSGRLQSTTLHSSRPCGASASAWRRCFPGRGALRASCSPTSEDVLGCCPRTIFPSWSSSAPRPPLLWTTYAFSITC